ncbi:MAG: hypothetical protein FJW79_10140, partial [Actinobacteria bacterium]|nr:hypothetical protein [Actinomycetota bacterium]
TQGIFRKDEIPPRQHSSGGSADGSQGTGGRMLSSRRLGRRRAADVAAVTLFAGTVAGVLFSAYLTFLEPFVIGATCAWCLASAVIITLLMWLTARPAAGAWRRLRQGGVAPH